MSVNRVAMRVVSRMASIAMLAGAFALATPPARAQGVDSTFLPAVSPLGGGELIQGFIVVPIFIFDRDDDRTTLWFLPYWQRKDPNGWVRMLPPLYYQSHSQEHDTLWVIPYYSADRGQSSTRALHPIYLTRERRGEGSAITTRTLNILGPLFRREADFNASGELTRRYRRFLIFSGLRSDSGGREFRVLGLRVFGS